MIGSFSRVVLTVIALCTISTVAQAKVVACTFDKVTSVGMGSKKNTRDFLGETITFDTTKELINVKWTDGVSGWMSADKIMKNGSFTSYILFSDIEFSDGTYPMKFLFRLSADEAGAEVRSEMQKNAGGGREWKENAARYTCA